MFTDYFSATAFTRWSSFVDTIGKGKAESWISRYFCSKSVQNTKRSYLGRCLQSNECIVRGWSPGIGKFYRLPDLSLQAIAWSTFKAYAYFSVPVFLIWFSVVILIMQITTGCRFVWHLSMNSELRKLVLMVVAFSKTSWRKLPEQPLMCNMGCLRSYV